MYPWGARKKQEWELGNQNQNRKPETGNREQTRAGSAHLKVELVTLMPQRLLLRSVRPVPFWLWLSDPDPKKLRPMLAQIREQGAGGIVLRPFPRGFRDEEFHSLMGAAFATEEYFRRSADLAALAFEAGLDCWLHDEGGWPSGVAAGEVVRAYPEMAARVLRCYPGPPPSDFPVVHADDECHYRVEMLPDRTDVFNPLTVQRLIEIVHEGYRRRLKAEFGKRVPGIFTEEPGMPGRVGSSAIPWIPEIERLFRRRKGYMLPPRLACLFSAEAAAGAHARFSAQEIGRTRRDFLDVLSIRLRDGYFRPLNAWCEQNNLLLAGHVAGDESLKEQAFGSAGQPLRMLRQFHLPGVDVPMGHLRQSSGSELTDFPRLAASAAAFNQRRDAVSSPFAGSGWGLRPAEMLWSGGYQLIRGITLFCPVGICSGTGGAHLWVTQSDLGPASPLHAFFGLWADTMSRAGEAARKLPRDLRVGVYWPLPEVWEGKDVPIAFEAVCLELSRSLIDFNWWDDDALVDAEVERGELVLGLARCKVVLIPAPVEFSERAVERLKLFLSEGGKILCPGGIPAGLADLPSVEAVSDDLGDRLRALLDPSIRWEPSSPHLHGVRLGTVGEPGFILFNAGASLEIARIELPVRIGEAPTPHHVMDPESGAMFPATGPATGSGVGGSMRFDIAVPTGGIRLLLRGGVAETARPAADYRPAQVLVRVTDGWRVSGALRSEVTPEGVRTRDNKERYTTVGIGDWSRQGLTAYSGTLAYEVDFVLPERSNQDAPLMLDLGDVRHAARVWLNGKDLGRRAWAPYRFELAGRTHLGRNRLRVEVTNTLANQVLQPELIAEARKHGWWNRYAEADSRAALVSGLLGPVEVWEAEAPGTPRRMRRLQQTSAPRPIRTLGR